MGSRAHWCERMRLDSTQQIEREITPIIAVHGVELVALEWLGGPGHGILRITVDLPNSDPRNVSPNVGISLSTVTDITRDVSSALDTLDLIDMPYTLEIGSPGPERPVQKRVDFERFAGLLVKMEARKSSGGKGRVSIQGTLRGVKVAPTQDKSVTAQNAKETPQPQEPPQESRTEKKAESTVVPESQLESLSLNVSDASAEKLSESERETHWSVLIETAPGVTDEIASTRIVRAKLLEQKFEKGKKSSGKIAKRDKENVHSRRQERLVSREHARAVNAAHLAKKAELESSDKQTSQELSVSMLEKNHNDTVATQTSQVKR